MLAAAASRSASNQGDNDTPASDDVNELSLSLYRVTFVARERLDLPAYLGSTLRGAFGHVFRTLACPGRFNEPCPIPNSCPYHLIFETSPPPDSQALRTHDEIPRPFVIAPNTDGGWLDHGRRLIEPGDELSFDLTLIGRAQEYFPYFVVAFREIDRLGRRRAAAGTSDAHLRFEPAGVSRTPKSKSYSPISDTIRSPVPDQEEELSEYPLPGQGEGEGVGAPSSVIPSETSASQTTRDQRAAITHPARMVELRRIDLLDPLSDAAWPVYNATDNMVHPLRKPLTLSECAAIPPPTAGRLTLDFLTQTRLKHEGGWTRIPEFQIVFRRLIGRLSSLSRFHCGTPLEVDFRDLIERAGEVRLIDNQTRWVSWTRFSNRQRQRMDWEGLIGRATYEGDFALFWPYVLFGQSTHVGKGATFGLGKYYV